MKSGLLALVVLTAASALTVSASAGPRAREERALYGEGVHQELKEERREDRGLVGEIVHHELKAEKRDLHATERILGLRPYYRRSYVPLIGGIIYAQPYYRTSPYAYGEVYSFVASSTYNGDGLGLSPYEAQIIASNWVNQACGGANEVLEIQETFRMTYINNVNAGVDAFSARVYALGQIRNFRCGYMFH